VSISKNCFDPHYAAPEVFKGLYHMKVDEFSAGVVIYQLLNLGKYPFKLGRPAHDVEMYNRLMGQDLSFEGWEERVVESEGFQDIVEGLLHKNELKRWTAKKALKHPLFHKLKSVEEVSSDIRI